MSENVEIDIQKETYGTTNPIDVDNKEAIIHNKNASIHKRGSEVSETKIKAEVNLNEGTTLPDAEVIVYKSRFWILSLFFYCAFLVILVWGTFGPIMDSAEYAFGWSDGYIALLDGWGPIFSVLCMIPFNFMTQKFGLRIGLLLSITLVTIATGVRCITLEDTTFTYLASVAAILNGMASCLTLSLPAMLSSTWFPVKERATATAVAALATQLAGAGMYLSPLIVRTPDGILTRDEIKHDIRILLFIHFGMSVLGLLCTVIYYPKEPPTPPSPSSSVERVDYFKSLKILIGNPQVMGVVATYIFTFSIPISWVSVMNFSLGCIGISQDESMWIAITACIVSSGLAFVVALLTDYFYGYLRISIIGLLFGSSAFYLWFLLITEKVIIISSTAQVFVSVVAAISLQYAAIPLLIELAVELAYPCPESVVGAIMTFTMDSCSTIFLLLMIIPSECYIWLSYVLLASAFVTIGPLIFVKEVHNRSKVDRTQ